MKSYAFPTHLIYDAMGAPPIDAAPADGICCLCGSVLGEWERKRFIKEGFTNQDQLRASDSQAVCSACAVCLDEPKMRTSSWIAVPCGLRWLKRDDFWSLLFSRIPTPFVLYFTTSFKKHGSFKALINYSSDEFYVQFEETGITFRPEQWREPARTIQALYSVAPTEQWKKQPRTWFTKEEIRTGNYRQHRIREYGLDRWHEMETIISPLRPSPVFGMLVHAVNQRGGDLNA